MAYLTVGGLAMQSYGFVSQIISIIPSVIVYFAAFILFFSQIIGKLGKRGGQNDANANADQTPPAPPIQSEKGGDAQ